jgi:hypothetical protein
MLCPLSVQFNSSHCFEKSGKLAYIEREFPLSVFDGSFSGEEALFPVRAFGMFL